MRRSNFTMIPNEIIDSKIDYRAIALYVYLTRLKVRRASYWAIMKALNIGSKTTVKKLIDILREEGWLDYMQGNLNKGSNAYSLYWTKKCTGTSTPRIPAPVHGMDSINTNIINTSNEDEELMKWQQQKTLS